MNYLISSLTSGMLYIISNEWKTATVIHNLVSAVNWLAFQKRYKAMKKADRTTLNKAII